MLDRLVQFFLYILLGQQRQKLNNTQIYMMKIYSRWNFPNLQYVTFLCCALFFLCFQRAMDLLLMKFTSAIHDKAYSVVAEYARETPKYIDIKTSYANLCKIANFILPPPTHIISHNLLPHVLLKDGPARELYQLPS